MKLTMENQYSFQRAMGYNGEYPDDPAPMEVGEVAAELRRWRASLSCVIDNGSVAAQFHDDLVQIENFLDELGYRSEVEYEHPLNTFAYHAGFEYFDKFEVIAESQEQADEQALKVFKAMAEAMPKQINEVKGCFKYLEQYDPNYGYGKRIYED